MSIERDGQFRTSLYDKRDDFNFDITDFTFLSSNISSSPAYVMGNGVFISQLIRFARACSSDQVMKVLFWERCDFHVSFSGRDMSGKRLKSFLRKFYGRYGDHFKPYEVPLSQMLNDILGHFACTVTQINSDTLHWSDISLNRDFVTEPDFITVFDVITLFRGVSIGHLQRVWLANRGLLLLRTPAPVPFGTCIYSNAETIFSWTLQSWLSSAH